MPSLPLSNQFAVLSITPENEVLGARTAKAYVVAANPSLNSLNLKVEVQTTDMAEVKGVTTLPDSGATGLFIYGDFVAAQKLTTSSLTHPAPVYNADGTLNEYGEPHPAFSKPFKACSFHCHQPCKA